MKYRLQESRRGDEWKDIDKYPRDEADLAAWVRIGNNQETHDGRYEFRIIDGNEIVMWTRIPAYESVNINLADLPGEWMRAVQRGYGIKDNVWAAECWSWIARWGNK